MSSISQRVRLLLLLLLTPIVTAQTCFFPSGKVAANYTSCNESADVSNCCDKDSVCLSNGFCMSQKSFGNRLLRGACTERSFGAGCQQICKDTFPDGQASVLMVGDFDPASYCCGNINNGKCSFSSGGSTEPFRGPANGAVIWNRKTGSSDWTLINNASSGASQTVTVTVSSTGTSRPVSGKNEAASSDKNDSTAPLEETCPRNNTVAVGAGVGSAFGVALAIVGALLFMQVRKRQDAERRLEEVTLAPPAHYDIAFSSPRPPTPPAKADLYGAFAPPQTKHEPRGEVSELHGNHVGQSGTPEMRA